MSLLALIVHQFVIVNIEKIRTDPVVQSMGFMFTAILVMFFLPMVAALIPVSVDKVSSDLKLREDIGKGTHN